MRKDIVSKCFKKQVLIFFNIKTSGKHSAHTFVDIANTVELRAS